MTEMRQAFTQRAKSAVHGVQSPMAALDKFPGKYTRAEFESGRTAEFH